MKSKARCFFFLFVAAAMLASCASVSAPKQASSEAADAQLVEQTVIGVNWMQQSGEYRALAYQTFNTARMVFDHASVPSGKKKAVVADLDETLLDNSKEAAHYVIAHKGFSPAGWEAWSNAKKADAVPGAVEFSNYVNANNAVMFFVSNRKAKTELECTMENMKALGFTNVTPDRMLLKEKNSNKIERFKQIEDMGYEIVMYIGDNLDDFTGETYRKLNADRRSFVDANKKDFGVKYIVLPNPLYGSFEGGLAADYFKKSPEERVKIRYNNLKSWK